MHSITRARYYFNILLYRERILFFVKRKINDYSRCFDYDIMYARVHFNSRDK